MQTWLDCLRDQRAIAVIRSDDPEQARRAAHALAAGGLRSLEITWNSAQPDTLVRQLRQELPHCWLGAGTILERGQLDAAIAAGSQFIFSPHVNADLIAIARAADRPIVAGALTPSEIVAAWQAGATAVKVFPVQALGGADYIRRLQGPLGTIPLIPTGGVTCANARELIQAGAIAVGLASQLLPPELMRDGDWNAITNRARDLLTRLKP
ncbi:MAG: bifunctional 4-hydroxy-2-oxoglutarate aldolase/2-dehydro-3-deoxy-phosphogluconate aldolase [Spirulinaceae cyanobacterium SM2_1_0]|nr:bifunctional 4-hydroxy-2-oxoglutarate aldolase/2-dehydro-3-deoxy-phosphogluconate aldolase [Spirulinaceae cyanobacterium SM2_1_0]